MRKFRFLCEQIKRSAVLLAADNLSWFVGFNNVTCHKIEIESERSQGCAFWNPKFTSLMAREQAKMKKYWNIPSQWFWGSFFSIFRLKPGQVEPTTTENKELFSLATKLILRNSFDSSDCQVEDNIETNFECRFWKFVYSSALRQ